MAKGQGGEQLLKRILAEKGLLDEAGFSEHRAAFAQATKLGVKTTLLKFLIDRGVVSQEDAADVRKEFVRRGRRPMLGEYELIEKLGEGGMGTVYKAQHPRLKTIVAIKQVAPEIAKDKRRLRRFEREAQVAAKLTDVDIVRVMDVQVDGPRPFIVMEYVDGETLEDIVRRGPMDEKEALGIVRDVAATLHVLHENGVIHRDIKPANIMITSAGKVKVADLGIAKELAAGDTSVTMAGSGIGTPAYAAPEQSTDAKAVDHRADIYALGGTLYNMVTGHMPFRAETPYKMMMMHANEPLIDPTEFRPELSRGTADLICNMMEKSPDARIQSADAVTKIAQALIDGLASGAVIAGTPPRTGQERRSPWKLAGAACIAAILIVASIFYLINRNRAESVHNAGEPMDAPASTEPATPPSPDAAVALPPSAPFKETTRSTTGTMSGPKRTVPATSTPIVPQPGETVSAEVAAPKTRFEAPPLPAQCRVERYESAKTNVMGMYAQGDSIWCATRSGAARYDTKTRTWAYSDERDGAMIAAFSDVVVDRHGKAWFLGLQETVLLCYDGKEWQSFDRTAVPGLTPLCRLGLTVAGDVCLILRDGVIVRNGDAWNARQFDRDLGLCAAWSRTPDGMLVSVHTGGLRFIRADDGTVKHVLFPKALGTASPYSHVFAEPEKRCWCTLDMAGAKDQPGLWLLEEDRFSRPDVVGQKPEDLLGAFALHPKLGLHVFAEGGWFRLYRGSWRRVSMNKKTALFQAYDALVGADACFYLLDGASRRLHQYDGRSLRELQHHALLPAPARCVRVDAEGTVWVGTEDGLLKFDGTRWRLVGDRTVPAWRGKGCIHQLALGRDGSLTATVGSVVAASHLVSLREGRWREAGEVDHPDYRSNMLVDPNGSVWVSGRRSLAQYRDGKVETFDASEGLHVFAGHLALDVPGKALWYVPARMPLCIARFDGRTWQEQEVVGVPDRCFPWSFAVDAQGRLWLGMHLLNEGLCALLLVENGRVTDVQRIHPAQDPVGKRPLCMRFDPQGRLWMGLEHGGIACYDGKTWRYLDVKDGLIGNRVYDFDFAPDGSVWVAGPVGVSHLVFNGE